MTATIQNTNKRPFTIIYDDCFESDVFDNIYQKMVYMTLKKFANSNNQCFPSLKKIASVASISIRKVQETLKELRDKVLIGIKSQFRPDGGRTSNLYTIYDIAELHNTSNEKETTTTLGEKSVLKTETEITSNNTTIKKATVVSEAEEDIEIKKEPISAQNKVTDIDINNKLKINDTTQAAKSQVQPSERYTLDQIHQHFDYETLIQNPHYVKERIDSVMSILYTALNTTKPTIRINGEDKPSKVVISKLMKLNMMDIEYSIDKFKEQTERINNPTAYMLTILYNSKEQAELDFTNMVEHDMYYGTLAQSSKKTAEQLFNQQENYNQNKPKNQFHGFMEREMTKGELDELERKLLGN